MYTTASMFVIVSTGYVIQTLSLCIFRRYITTILSLRIFVLYSLFCVYSFFADRISSIEVRRSKQRRIGLSILIMKKNSAKRRERKKWSEKKTQSLKTWSYHSNDLSCCIFEEKVLKTWFIVLNIEILEVRRYSLCVCIDFCSPT